MYKKKISLIIVTIALLASPNLFAEDVSKLNLKHMGSLHNEYYYEKIYNFYMADSYLIKGDVKQAIPHLIEAAKGGVSQATYNLVELFINGYGDANDILKSKDYIENEAFLGNVSVQEFLADQYYSGVFGENKLKSVFWYKMSSENGSNRSAYIYANMLIEGHMLNQDVLGGLSVLKKLAKLDPEVSYRISEIYKTGYGDVRRDQNKRIKYLNIAADQKHEVALLSLADIYIRGEGVEPDVKWGNEILETAISMGNHKAYYAAAKNIISSKNGIPNKEEVSRAVQLLMEAADNGVVEAQTLLGDMYSSKQYGIIDYESAVKWYTLSSDKDPLASRRLALIYRNGVYNVPRDINKAKMYTEKAIRTRPYSSDVTSIGNRNVQRRPEEIIFDVPKNLI
jgi:TPR repeat protein